MKQRFLSIILCITLMASVIAGAISVSVFHAKADEESILYWDDFVSYVIGLDEYNDLTGTEKSNVDSFLSSCETYIQDSNKQVLVMRYGIAFSLLVIAPSSGQQLVSGGYIQNGSQYWYYQDTSYYGYCQCFGFLRSSSYGMVYTSSPGSFVGSPRNRAVELPLITYQNAWFSPYEEGVYECYSSQNIMTNSTYQGFSFAKNIELGSSPPQYIEFNVVSFYLGERLYFTFKEQDVFREIEPDKSDYMLGVFHDNSDSSELFTWEDVTLLPGAENFTNINWSNVSPMGIYAIDITNKGWVIIDMANLIEFDGDINPSFAGYAINTPYRIGDENPEPGTNGTPDSYTEVFNNWNTYITNYPNSPIVAQDLVPQFYNTQAASCRPCEVAVPSSLWNARSEVTVFGQDIFEYHFPLVSSPIYNYELFDVCVLSRQGIITGNILEWDYSLMWWYSDSSSPQSTKIQDLNFNVLMEMFDIIIIVDDPDLVLMNSYGDLVYTGDYEYGFTYSPNAFTYSGVLYGFAFVTEKAVQKQLLFNFNDGIRKTYDLMEQYIDHRQAWDNSFLDWTTTLFTQYQTIFGKLDDIYNVLFTWDGLLKNISDKLDQIAENTSEDDPGYWFISFYNWVKRWEPSNSDFANWVDSWDDFTDDLPDPGSGVTVIPFPTAIPTVAVAGG